MLALICTACGTKYHQAMVRRKSVAVVLALARVWSANLCIKGLDASRISHRPVNIRRLWRKRPAESGPRLLHSVMVHAETDAAKAVVIEHDDCEREAEHDAGRNLGI
jgi:hypothetical protein